MTTAPSPRPVSALRARMIEDMTVRGFTEETHSNYILGHPLYRGLSPPRFGHPLKWPNFVRGVTWGYSAGASGGRCHVSH
jgi:hypothetical protein